MTGINFILPTIDNKLSVQAQEKDISLCLKSDVGIFTPNTFSAASITALIRVLEPVPIFTIELDSDINKRLYISTTSEICIKSRSDSPLLINVKIFFFEIERPMDETTEKLSNPPYILKIRVICNLIEVFARCSLINNSDENFRPAYKLVILIGSVSFAFKFSP